MAVNNCYTDVYVCGQEDVAREFISELTLCGRLPIVVLPFSQCRL